MGVSLNGGTTISHPKSWSFLVGKPVAVGETHHFRKPPPNMIVVLVSWRAILDKAHPWGPDRLGNVAVWRAAVLTLRCLKLLEHQHAPTNRNVNSCRKNHVDAMDGWWQLTHWLELFQYPSRRTRLGCPVVLALPASMFSLSSVPTTSHPQSTAKWHQSHRRSIWQPELQCNPKSRCCFYIYPVILVELS